MDNKEKPDQKIDDVKKAMEFFPQDEMAGIGLIAESFQKNPSNEEAEKALRNLRFGFVENIIGVEEVDIAALFATNFGKVFQLISDSGLVDSELLPAEEEIANAAKSCLDGALVRPIDLRLVLVAMLYFRAHEIDSWPSLNAVPHWMQKRYFEFLFHVPAVFLRTGEADEYLSHMRRQFFALRQLLLEQSKAPLSVRILPKFLEKCNIVPLYFNTDSLKDIMQVRAEVSTLALRAMGAKLDYDFPKRSGGARIRVGVFDPSIAHRSETYVTLSALRLAPCKFSVHLITDAPIVNDDLNAACRRIVGDISILPKGVSAKVEFIRRLDLDVMLIGTNMCAAADVMFLVFLHRVARVQMVSYCSPVTTGSVNIDAFVSGTLACVSDSQNQFTERLLRIPGPPGCMDYTHDLRRPIGRFSKEDFGVEEDEVLFVSGANCYKILPEMQEVWAEILAAVPKSKLLLHPFNPNWAKAYPEARFRAAFARTLSLHGVDVTRLVISNCKLPSRADVVALMAIGDVYLDTFPYSGSISLTDPLETGVPSVVCEGESLRSRQGAALLRDIGIEELITTNRDEYIAKAIELANDPMLRDQLRSRILRSVSSKPRYLDPELYGRQLGLVLEKVVQDGLEACE